MYNIINGCSLTNLVILMRLKYHCLFKFVLVNGDIIIMSLVNGDIIIMSMTYCDHFSPINLRVQVSNFLYTKFCNV